ncbi:MAG: capsule biosynthesis protein CapD [Opitutia bacterium]|nr:MAG: capsule biosynthesis protein CapD [Opitutae bacterium]
MANPTHYLRRSAFFFALYGALAALSLWFAYELRFSGDAESAAAGTLTSEGYLHHQRPLALLWVVPTKVCLLWILGQFSGVFYYFRLMDAIRMVIALALAAGSIFLATYLFGIVRPEDIFDIPRGVVLIDFNLSMVLFVGFRVSIRAMRERFWDKAQKFQGARKRIAIIGAGQVGAQLAAELLSRRGHGIEPACFLDDDLGKHDLRIHGIPVIGAPERMAELGGKYGVTEIILALPANSVRRIREVSTLAGANNLRVLVVPSMPELAGGRVRASDIRPISVEDILGREPAQLDDIAIDAMVKGRTVLVTGAGGSIGSELCRQIAARSPARLIMVDQCEVLLYQTEQELIAAGAGALITPIVGDVTDADRMRDVFTRFKPRLVLHAAAHKHVPMMESQPAEALKNNVLGTAVVARLAAEHGAEKLVLISSDKAVNPTNVMGATKRLAEQLVRKMQVEAGGKTSFLAVRFGNVLGSSGSVIPLFRRQISEGGPVTVTHPDVKRYFMTIPEAVGLVLQSATLGQGGDILVLEMGQPLKIIDVARQLIELSGLRPDIDIEIRIVGLRPGEKLVEELNHEGEQYHKTRHPRVFRFVDDKGWKDSSETLISHVQALLLLERQPCKQGMRDLVPEYVPFVE